MEQSFLSEIQECEDKLKEAMLNSDTKLLDDLLSPELIFTNHLGQTMTKEDDLRAHSTGALKIERIDISDQNIKVIGNIGIVTAQARILGSFKGESSEGVFRFTRVWTKGVNSSWQIEVGHSCLVS